MTLKQSAMSAILGIAMLGATLPVAAQADDYYNHHHHYRHYRRDYACERERRHAANTGTVVGAIGGGLAGNLLSGGGGKLGGTLIGAGVGAVAGHEIAKNQHRC